jgi:serine O-acetyltransferase
MGELREDLRVNRGAGILARAMIVTLHVGRASRSGRGAKTILSWPARALSACAYRVLATSLGCSVPFSVKIGSRVRWPHAFSGIFITRNAIIGDDCTILHQVTIGSNYTRPEDERASPIIGNGVFIGAGAKIIGGVTIGADARIGANAVVVRDVPPGATCFAPAAEIRQKEDKPR